RLPHPVRRNPRPTPGPGRAGRGGPAAAVRRGGRLVRVRVVHDVTELPLFDAPPPPAPEARTWTRCDDCGRRIWAGDAIRAALPLRQAGGRLHVGDATPFQGVGAGPLFQRFVVDEADAAERPGKLGGLPGGRSESRCHHKIAGREVSSPRTW